MRTPTYATGDLYLSAFLVAKGYPVLDTYPGKRVSFVFPAEVKEDARA
jgi:hypothetical protein